MNHIIKSIFTLIFISFCNVGVAQNKKATLILNDELILKAYDTSKINTIKGSFSKDKFQNKRYLRIETKKGKVFRGFLMAYHKHGLFLLDKRNIGFSYVDYKYIKGIYFGRSYGNWVGMSTAGVAGLTTIVGLASGDGYAIVYGWIAGFVTATYGQIGTALAYGLYKGINNCHWRIKYNRKEGQEVSDFIDSNIEKFADIQNTTALTIQKSVLKIDSISNSENTIYNTNKDTNLIASGTQNDLNQNNETKKTKTLPSKVSFLEGLEFEKNDGVGIEWVLKNFDPKSVNEGTLMKDFKNLKGIQIAQNQLLKLNTSSLQFLALIICESGGYDIKALLKLTDKQIKEIVFYEPSIVDPVTPQSVIDKSYISEIDLQNLQVIYSELKSR